MCAATLRWSSQGDIVTQDPHAQDEGFTKSIQWLVYERLTQAGKDMAVRPWLATGWKIVSPTQRLVYLRDGVKFTDGTEKTAEFSLRGRSGGDCGHGHGY